MSPLTERGTAREAPPVVDSGEGHLAPHEVKGRATAGAMLIGVRAATTQTLAFAGNVILARLLVPDDFGAVAFGATLVTVAGFLSDGGLGVALIRRTDAPSIDDLRALLGLQLLTSTALAAITIVAGVFVGHVGLVAAVMALSLPFVAARASSTVLLERRLLYRPLVIAEFVESLTYYLWAIPAVLVGFGVWGLASGAVVRSVVATAVLIRLSPAGWIGARLNFGRLRSLLGFGARFQARGVVALIRDEGLNLGIAAVAGLSVLGIWSLAARVMQVPFLVFSALLRVSYPAMSRLNRSGSELRVTVENLAAMTSLLAVAVLAPLAGVADELIPAVFGGRWAPAAEIITWASVGLIFSGPISVACSGYLYATNDPRTPLRATAANGAVWLVIALALIRTVGPAAVGIGWLAASLTEALIFSRTVKSRLGARLFRVCLLPACLAVPTALSARMLEISLGGGLGGAIVGAPFGGAVYLALVLLFARRSVGLLAAAVRRAHAHWRPPEAVQA
jgi:O-antigen/teichoic acid export membrane protein